MLIHSRGYILTFCQANTRHRIACYVEENIPCLNGNIIKFFSSMFINIDKTIRPKPFIINILATNQHKFTGFRINAATTSWCCTASDFCAIAP